MKTKKDFFKELLNLVTENAELTAFLNKELELLEKRSSRVNSTKVEEQEKIKNEILQALKELGGSSTVTEVLGSKTISNRYSNQKISAMLSKLIKDGKVEKTIEKKKSYFSIV